MATEFKPFLEIVDEVKPKLKIRYDTVVIEDWVFKVFTKFTPISLIICCALVTLQKLIGEHIRCLLPPKEDVREEALNNYCFIMGTYTLPDAFDLDVGTDTAHFGVAPWDGDTDKQRYHYYYQWVPFALFFQALSFFVPHLLWKAFENRKIKTFCALKIADDVDLRSKKRKVIDLKDPAKIDEKDETINKVATLFVQSLNYNSVYAITYVACEVLNLLIVVINWSFTNTFLNKQFTTYGSDVVHDLKQPEENRTHPMDIVFPKVAKCDFHKYGPSGSLMRYDIMCVLALNIINEKIYVYLWFLFIILMVLGSASIIYRAFVIFIPIFKRRILWKKSRKAGVSPSIFNVVMERLSYSDWFVLHLLSVNFFSINFRELMEKIAAIKTGSIQLEEYKTKPYSSSEASSPVPAYEGKGAL